MGDLDTREQTRLNTLFREQPRADAGNDLPMALPPGTLFARIQTLWRCDELRALGGDGVLALARCLEAVTSGLGNGTNGNGSGGGSPTWRDQSFYLVIHPLQSDSGRRRRPGFASRMQRHAPDPSDAVTAFRLAPSRVAGLVQAFPETAVFLLRSLAQETGGDAPSRLAASPLRPGKVG
jgi:hypothetical protein